MIPRSPISDLTNVSLEKKIRSDFIIETYRKQLDVDVTKYFEGIENIEVYRCQDSGFRFYYPFTVSGDEAFYEQLQHISWYYMDWKWEHDVANTLLRVGQTVLEVGCARGSFLERLGQRNIEGVGLELNRSAVRTALSNGLTVLNEPLEEHALQNIERYDVVCSFQVVEHLFSIRKFIEDCIDVLKPHGTLIISVPNNDSLIFRCNDDIALNLPPHHMGLWNLHSLIALQNIFGIKLERIDLEPLQPYHAVFATKVAKKEMGSALSRRFGRLGPLIRRAGDRFISNTAVKLSPYLIGHTILAQYSKL